MYRQIKRLLKPNGTHAASLSPFLLRSRLWTAKLRRDLDSYQNLNVQLVGKKAKILLPKLKKFIFEIVYFFFFQVKYMAINIYHTFIFLSV